MSQRFGSAPPVDADDPRRLAEAILNSLPAHIALLDRTGRITQVNDAWRRFAADNGLRDPDGAVGRNYLELCSVAAGPGSDDARQAYIGIRGVMDGRQSSFEFEYQCAAPGAPPRWFRLLANPVRHGEDPASAVVMHLDVTQRRLIQLSLRESERRYREIFDNDLTASANMTVDGHLLTCNPAFLRLFQVGRVPTPIRFQDLCADPQGGAHLLARAREAGRLAYEHLSLRTTAGTPLHVIANFVASSEDDGTVRRLTGYFVDDTERRLLEDRYRQAQKMEAIGQLAGGIAHDFNNLLTVIAGSAELLLDELAAGSEARQLADEIAAASGRAARMTRQLLSFSRRQIVSPRVIDVNEVVVDMEKLLRRSMGEDVAVSIDLSHAPCPVLIDPGQLEQVLINLSVNAHDAMPTGGRLEVATALETGDARGRGARVRLTVRDTGTGMSEEVKRHAFEPFFTTKAPGRGTGLGLATVYGVVRQANGEIEIESAPGQGTTIVVVLPRAARPAGKAGAPRANEDSRGTETILLVEDERGVRLLARRALEAGGYEVLEADSAEQALAVAGAHPGRIHLLLSDVVMPGDSGVRLAERLGGHRPGIKILFMSGYTEERVTAYGSLGTDVPLLAKPFTPSALRAKVRQVLDR